MRGCLACLAVFSALGLAACGGGTSQDANEPAGTYQVDVVKATFPAKQRLAQKSVLSITVRNAGDKTIPNLAATVETGDKAGGANGSGNAQAFAEASQEPGLADPSRPVWVLDSAPRGGVTAYTNTWALGALKPGEQRTFLWHVTAVKSGVHSVKYEVAAGLDGKAKAVLAGGNQRPAGQFTIDISGKPANARVGDNGQVIVSPQG
ncbi:MAG: hypothetical protein QOJ97_2238 [Solirubrobacteraceae bacterium]|jgi:hypothetical protein|nr:hypothetical protein [Solirubrobacteraceae bacterium]